MFSASSRIILSLLLLGLPALALDVEYPAGTPQPAPGYGETVSGSYMGVDVQEVTAERMRELKLKEERGAEITMVDRDAPAGKAGLREHDVILEFNHQKVEGVEELRRLIHEIPPGRTVPLLISRDGKAMSISVTLADKKKYVSENFPKDFHVVIPKMAPMPQVVIPNIDLNIRTFSTCGLVVENLTPQLGDFLGVKDGQGVLVRSVEKGSPAEAAGFKAGDVIVRFDNEKIGDRGDWRSALRNRKPGKVTVGIIRDKREQTLTLEIPENKSGQNGLYMEWPDADTFVLDLDELQSELDRMQPELRKNAQQALQQGQIALARTRKELERAQAQAAKESQKALILSQKEVQRALDQAMEEAQRQMKCYQEQLKQMHWEVEEQ